MEKIKVDLKDYPYEIVVGQNIFENLSEIVESKKLNKHIFCLIDKTVYTLYKKELEKVFTPQPGKFSYLTIDSKEKNKSLSTLGKIFSSLVLPNYGRDSLLIAIGGGIIGDLGGFASATYSRGIQYIQIPTTLLATVDSSVGGKTGINFGKTKNIVGAFYQPKFVLVDTEFLKTLPPRERISGVGEIVKYAFLIGDNFYSYVDKNLEKLIDLDNKVVTKVISESVKYKGAVVVQDEKEESGLRKILNLGHTFGHAIEIEQGHKLKHGECVIVGLACALYLSHKLGYLNDKKLVEGLTLIKRVSNSIKIKKYDRKKIMNLMKRDKKSKDEVYRFVLLQDFGKVLVDVEAENDDVNWAIKTGIRFFQ